MPASRSGNRSGATRGAMLSAMTHASNTKKAHKPTRNMGMARDRSTEALNILKTLIEKRFAFA
jgi:hypothetical protein